MLRHTIGAGMLTPVHSRGADAPHLRNATVSHSPHASQFGKHLGVRRENGRLCAASNARGGGESAPIDWSTLLRNPNLKTLGSARIPRQESSGASASDCPRQSASKACFALERRYSSPSQVDKTLFCLLQMLANLQEQWGWDLGVAHCDHQWSTSSQKQGAHVAQIAASLRVKYYQAVTTSPVPGEGVARTWRYGVFERIALRHGYNSIVTAHTASDRVETLLYNLFRGSGLHGLQSLTWKRVLSPSLALSHRRAFMATDVVSALATEEGTVELGSSEVALVRPLLGFTRTELREYCDLLGLRLWPDPSNMSLEIDRNRIRHELLPYLRENFNDSVDRSLARCAEILHAEQQYLDSVCESILRKAETRDADGRKLDIVVLQSLPVALQRRVVKQFVENFTGRSLGFDHVERLRASYSLSPDTQNASYGVNLALPGNASVRVLKTHFHLTRTK